MIFDVTTLLSNAQPITATAPSTNTIDLGQPGTVFGAAQALVRDVGKGKPIPFRLQVVQSFNTLTSLTFTLETDDNSGFSSPKIVWTSGAVPLASLVAGYVRDLEYLPRGVDERYLRMNYTVAGTPPTLGQVTAGVVMAGQSNS